MTSRRPHHASPWVLDTRPLGRRPGSMKPYRFTAPVGEPMGIEVIKVPTDAEIDLDVRLESVAEGVLVSGAASGVAVGECARCLTDLTVPVTAELRELFAYPDSTTAATTDDDEIPRLIDDLIDLEPLVRDEIVLTLPLAPLCRPDCAGLCVDCGDRLDDLEPGHSHEILDPRWADLAAKFGLPVGPSVGPTTVTTTTDTSTTDTSTTDTSTTDTSTTVTTTAGTISSATAQPANVFPRTNGRTVVLNGGTVFRTTGVGDSDADSISDDEEK